MGVYQTRKQLSEFGDKLPQDIKEKVEDKLKDLDDAIKTDETSNIKASMDSLQQEVMKMGQALYGQQNPQTESQQATSENSKTETKKTSNDDVIDADFTDRQ